MQILRTRRQAMLAGLLTLTLTATLGFTIAGHSNTAASAPPQRSHYGPMMAGDQDDTYYGGYRGSTAIQAPHGNGTLSGKVTDATTGQGVGGVDIGVAHGVMGETTGSYTKTAADGTWSIGGLSGTYNVIASRYEVNGTKSLYISQSKMGVSAGGTVNFALQPVAAPGSRTVPSGRAKNLILVDFDETYFECWFTDGKCGSGRNGNVTNFAKTGGYATNSWTIYGWSPIDHYQIAVGSYPDWRTPDQPAKVWGGSEQIDTCIWYNNAYGSCKQTTPEYFLQSSIFDVAKAHGMSTAVIGGNDYPTGHIIDNNVDLIQLNSGTPNPTLWLSEVEKFFTAHANNPNGTLLYFPCTPAENLSVESTSPDASGSLYQQATASDNQTFGKLMSWLKSKGYLANTAVAVTADEAENDHTSYDNFYGNGSTGTGTTRHVPFVISGPGVKPGFVYGKVMNTDAVPPTLMYELGLDGPYDARNSAVTDFFANTQPTPTPTPPGPTATPTPSPTPCKTCTATPTPIPPTATPTPSANLIQNPGFENGSQSWVLGGALAPSVTTAQARGGSHSLLIGTIAGPGQNGASSAYQQVSVPAGGASLNLSYWIYGVTNDQITYAWQDVQIQSASGTVLKQIFKGDNNDQKWDKGTANVSAYIGKTIRVYFDTVENGQAKYYCGMYLDDVTLAEQ